jgi:tetratricopeptide (TPR) repeat protein
MVVLAVGFLVYLIGVFVWLTTRAKRRVDRLNESQDYDGARKLMKELRAVYPVSPEATRMFQLVEGTQLCIEARYPEAISVLSSLDVAKVKAAFLPAYLNSLAWSLALSGNAAEAVLRARECVAASEAGGKATPLQRASHVGTLGTALVLAGEADEGVTLLEEALALRRNPRGQAAHAFFLGEGMRALGRYDEAADAYRRAVAESPSTEFGQRATASLQKLAAYRS